MKSLRTVLIASVTFVLACGKDTDEPDAPAQDMAQTVDMNEPEDMTASQDMAQDMAMPDLAQPPPDQFMPQDMGVVCLGQAGEMVPEGETLCQGNALYLCTAQAELVSQEKACGDFPVDIRIKVRVDVTDTYTGAYGIHPVVTITNVGTSETTKRIVCEVQLYEQGKFFDKLTEEFVPAGLAPGDSFEAWFQSPKTPQTPKVQGRVVYTCSTENESPAAATLGNTDEAPFAY